MRLSIARRLAPLFLIAACHRAPAMTATATTATTEATARPIFRYVAVSGGRFELGQPIAPEARATLLDAVDDSTVRVRRGVYGSAREVVLHLTRDGAPWLIGFEYDSTRYWPTVAEYEALLGAPTRLTGAGTDTTALWEDARTQFQPVRRRDARGGRTTVSTMLDRQRGP